MRTIEALGCALVLAASGCVVKIDGWGSDTEIWGRKISESDGKLVVDGVRLPYDRWVDVDLDAAGLDELKFGTAFGPIDLTGADEPRCRLQVRVHSQHAEDGEVAFDAGKLVARSEKGIVFIDGVRGSVPAAAALRVDSGSGDVQVDGASKAATLTVCLGSGDVVVRNSHPAKIEIDSGSSDVLMEESGSADVAIDTGSGDVHVLHGVWGRIRMGAGSGDLVLEGATADAVELSAGSGDLVLKQSTVEVARLDAGSGDLIIRGGRCGTADIDSGSGDLEVLDGAEIGTGGAR